MKQIDDDKRVVLHEKTKNLKVGECIICRLVVKAIKEITHHQHVTIDEVRNILKTICQSVLFLFRGPCDDFVRQYFDKIAKLVIDVVDEEKICSLIMVCEANSVGFNKPKQIGKNDVNVYLENDNINHPDVTDVTFFECPICRAVVKVTKEIVKHSFTRETVRKALKKACSRALVLKSKCHEFVDKFFDRIVELLVSASSRGKVCRLLLICAEEPVNPRTTLENYFSELDKDSCLPCKTVANLQKMVLESANISDALRNGVMSVCDLFPYPIQELCHVELKTYLNNWADMLRNINGEQVCKNGNICTSWNLLTDQNDYEKENCGLCRIAASVMKSIAENPDMSCMLSRGIFQLCELMPYPLKTVCHSELRTHWRDWLNLLKKFNAERFCRNSGLCSAWNKLQNNDINAGKESCGPCRIGASIMKSVVQNPEMSKMLYRGIFQLCDLMPEPLLKTVCHSELRTHWRDWLILLRKFNAERFCRNTGLCSIWYKIQNSGIDAGKESCGPCRIGASIMKSVVQNPEMSKMLYRGVFQLCDLMPEPLLKTVCHSELRTHWRDWLILLRKFNAERFCRNTGLCSIWYKIQNSGIDAGKESCGPCRIGASIMKSVVQNPEMSKMLYRGVFQLCDLMPEPLLKTVCHSELRTHWRDWVILLRKFNAERFCKNTGLCSIWNKIQNTGIIGGKGSCGSCRIAASIMKSVAENPDMSKMLYQGIFRLCDLMPEPLKTVCHSEQRTHWRDWLFQVCKFNAERFCRYTGLCYTGNKIQITGINADIEIQMPERSEVASVIKAAVEHPLVEVDIESMLRMHCEEMVTGEQRISCLNAVNEHGKIGIEYVIKTVKEFDDEQFLSKGNNLGGKKRCTSCKLIISTIRKVFKSEWSREEVKHHLVEACDYLVLVAGTCKSLVEKYSDRLIRMIGNHVNSAEICRQIHLCKKAEPSYNDIYDEIVRSPNADTQVDIEIQMPERSEVASVIKAAVEHPLVEVDIESMLRMHCEEMVTGEQRISCLNAVNEHGKIGIEYVIKTVKEFDDEQFLSKGNNLGGKKRCTSCKLIISTIRKVFKSEWSREEVKHHLVEACDYLVLVAGTCKSLVEKYSDRLIRMIGNHVNSAEICRQIHLCKKAEPSYNDIYDEIVRSPNADTQVDSNNCSVCLQSCSMVKENMGKSMEPLSHVLTGICHGFSENYKKLCLNVVNEHGKNGIEYLMKSVRQFDDEQMYLSKENNLGEKKRCISCKLIISTIRKVFKSEWSRNEVKQHLVEACDYLVLVAGTCKSLVEKYSDRLIRMIGNHVNSAEICRQINLCEKAELYYDAIYNETFRNPIEDTQIDSNNCSVCLQYCSMGKENMGKSVAPSSHVLSGICHGVSENYKKLCLDAVNEHGKNGIEYLIKTVREFDDEQMYLSKENNLGEKKRCISCKLIISTIRKVFKSEWSREEVKRHLVEACDYLVLVAGTCKSLVEKYSDRLIRMIGNHVNSAEICRQISLCEKAELSYNDIYNEILRSPNGDTQIDSNSCSVCLQYCSMVKENMGKSMERLSNLLSGICHGVSEKYTKVCLDDIKNYVREWMNNFNKINC